MTKNNSACFTGHRILNCDYKVLFNSLCKVIEESYVLTQCCDFYAGGAVGFDTIAEKAVIHLKDNKNLPIRLHLVLPCKKEDQTKNWTVSQKYDFNILLTKADSVEYTSKNYHPSCMKIRNKKLVEYSNTLCICYLEKDHKSGTLQTVSLANEKGLKIINMVEQINKTSNKE